MPRRLSLLLSNSPYLDSAHLDLQIDALNRQTSRDFQVFYLNQERAPQNLWRALKKAIFPFQIVPLPFPWLAETCCWDMVSVVGQILDQPVHGPYMSYLHKECLPAPDFVESLLTGIEQAEARWGPSSIYRLNQLRCQQSLAQLGGFYPFELAQAQPISWIERRPYKPEFICLQAAWQEDAFALPIELARQTKLFSSVSFPLFFQDLFDIFYLLPNLEAFKEVNLIHLGQPVIWHLNHPRHFLEYRREFLQEVRRHPQLFGHLALYELAAEDFHYIEDFEQGERIIPAHLHRFVHYMRYSEKGTVSLWQRALQHSYHHSPTPQTSGSHSP